MVGTGIHIFQRQNNWVLYKFGVSFKNILRRTEIFLFFRSFFIFTVRSWASKLRRCRTVCGRRLSRLSAGVLLKSTNVYDSNQYKQKQANCLKFGKFNVKFFPIRSTFLRPTQILHHHQAGDVQEVTEPNWFKYFAWVKHFSGGTEVIQDKNG